MRIVCQFSCGAASAVATKLALAQYGETHDVQIINALVKEEHPDNRRFLADCEKWFDRPITVLKDDKYGASTIEIFRRKQFIKSRYGAACTTELKRKLLDKWKQPGDVMVFGYTAEEVERLQGFPDDHTLIPVKRIKPVRADKLRALGEPVAMIAGEPWQMAADGPRYKALGNSWAVPKVVWIGNRINQALRAEKMETAA